MAGGEFAVALLPNLVPTPHRKQACVFACVCVCVCKTECEKMKKEIYIYT